MTAAGKNNLITDVSGILVGHAHDEAARTGVSVVRIPARGVAGVEQRGGAPGTRETDLMDPTCLVDAVDAIVLSGGSVYGLDAASAVTNVLGAQGHGFSMGGSPLVSPVVPAAILFDLGNGGDKAWGETPPYARLGREALSNVGEHFSLGNVGAGYGALAGAWKGGLGSASLVTPDGFEIGAMVAVNSFGSPVMPGGKTLWAAPAALGDEMGKNPMADIGKSGALLDFPTDTKAGSVPHSSAQNPVGSNTTIGVVAVNAALTSAEAGRLATMAEDGLARSIRPIHTPLDGDTIFSLATGMRELAPAGGDDLARVFALTRLGLLAADCLTRAVGRAIHEAAALGDAAPFRG